jgi:hypothetical protein
MGLTASVLLRLDWRAVLNMGHGALLGGVFLAAAAAAVLVAAQLRGGGLTPAGEARAVVLERALLIAAVAAGLAAAASGSWVLDPLFHTQAGVSPAEALRARPGYEVWAGVLLHLKEVSAWIGVGAALAALLVALRRGFAETGVRRPASPVLALTGAALVLGGLSGALGVLLTKIAPVM